MKQRLTSYTFDASEKTVLAAQFSDVTLAGIQLIVNVTDQIIIYNFADTSKGGTLSTDTLTLEYDTTSMSDADELMILVDDGVQTVAVTSDTLATAAKQDTIIGHLDGVETLLGTIDADTGSILGAVDGIEALLGTIDADTSAMVTDLAAIEVLLTTIESNQLADGHNVTVDNASIAVTGTFWQATQPVSGTVTAELSAVDNAVLDNIDADLTTIIGHVDGIETLIGTTNTTLTTIDGRVDGIEGLLTTIDADTSAMVVDLAAIEVLLGTIDADTGSIMTAVQLLDNTIFVDDAAFTVGASSVSAIGLMADEASTDSVDEGDIGIPRMTVNRKQIVTDRSATGTQTSVASSATNVTLLAANTSREGATLYNDSTQICYVRLQATATSSNFSVKMQPDDYYEVPAGYTGIIDGIWASANGSMRVTELT